MLDRSKLASLIERLEWHMKDSKVNLLIKEAIDTIIEQDKRMADLEATMDAVDGALCNYINGCCDGYEPVSQWDESNKHSFDELCRIYNEWHANNKDVGKISMDSFVRQQDEMRRIMVRSLKQSLYSAKASNEAQEIIERVIRRYENEGFGII